MSDPNISIAWTAIFFVAIFSVMMIADSYVLKTVPRVWLIAASALSWAIIYVFWFN